MLYRLVRWERGDRSLAVRSVWLLALAPPAFVFVMGYTDATAVALAIAVMYLLRKQRWWWVCGLVVVAGFAAQSAIICSGFRLWSRHCVASGCAVARAIGRIAAVGAAPVGTLVYLTWVGSRFGDFAQPFIEQTSAHLRGAAPPIPSVRSFTRSVARSTGTWAWRSTSRGSC